MKILTMAIAAVFGVAAPALAAPPPASAFGRIPAVVMASISPDGKRIAVLGGAATQRFVSIATIDQPGLPTVTMGDVEGLTLAWAGNEYVLARVAVWNQVDARRAYRFERYFAITSAGKVASQLLGKDVVSQFLTGQPVVGFVDGQSPRILMLGLLDSTGPSGDANTRLARKGVDRDFVVSLLSVDPATGAGSVVERGDTDTIGWDVDAAGAARVRLQRDEITHATSVMARAKGSSRWRKVWDGDDRLRYFGYSEPDDAVILTVGDRIVRKRLTDGATEALGSRPEASGSIDWDQVRQAPVGIVDTSRDKPVEEWLDPEIGSVAVALGNAFKGKSVNLTGWSSDRSRFVARVSAPSSPAVWYLFDKVRKEISPLGQEYPELADTTFGETRWIDYKARDGLQIHAYLTLPPRAASAVAKPPLIVLPHGGPAARDEFDFDFLVQFLASRGYAVLQPQFRGSRGFGEAFEEAGDGEWGGKMQTDLLDAVAAVAASGDADPGRVCIVGASYGGYAALAGATLNPDSYRCAASIAGIGDLGQFIGEKGSTYGHDSATIRALRVMLGRTGSEKLAANSPARHAQNVKIPILLIHGDQDTVVPIEQSLAMARALKAAGKPVDMVTLVNENHYLTRAATRTQMLEAVEQFLAKNLPPSAS